MKKNVIVPVILAGGSGSRLWPLSRQLHPKQLIALNSSKTMLQETVLRLSSLSEAADPIVICNDDHRFMVAEQLREVGIKPGAILLEPEGRNTAPAIGVCSIEAASRYTDPILLVLPADHFIADPSAFTEAVRKGAGEAEQGRLITFGIVPDGPETGYGYIQKGGPLDSGAFQIKRFVEKPDLETAESYVTSGEYLWNSGMFLFKASAILKEFHSLVPEILSACEAARKKAIVDLDFIRLDAPSFHASPSDSIDYAIMEKTGQGVMVPLEAGWSDLGSWEALWQVGKKDLKSNVTHGDVLTHDVRNSFLHAESRMIAAVGLENHIVVETPDAVLVSPRDRVQDVRKMVEYMRLMGREEAISHRRVYRPWGSYETIAMDNRFQVKRITVKPGAKLSAQKHYHRAEHWVVVRGTAVVERDGESILLREDESIYIPLGATHRLENPGKIPLDLIEVQSGSYLGEDDIVRFDDVYGRVPEVS
ncbi:mannose-1-phosphate guanylyltransferase/mannose-1-phosphate guanylyltransferase/mannose-6-phosphate isomerase [Desulfobotulus alkaliphilus]|uniref:mannose-1-phosphate guanylyltransferase n=1 Tax=Desulfobotulus alkaliphilus TaxID=622671 RepID=A0A562RZF3_9BACT|nr:mannose-1-phosphate guanylyltransferase/mannose-6-phosphate isomerase [Desulfobotulus alkaliphilus]TWI74328.1 mannose-1-phosphate guanylyltransferase/mannose-1-phosphate guanylyltransferase/mannose-6-phosphate isomerase [Desulfobotulus alkaliphilus]